MKRITLLSVMLIPLLCIAACSKPDNEAIVPDAADGAYAAEPDTATHTPFSCPEVYTDPSSVAVDASTLTRADGLVLDWDAAPQTPEDSIPSEFDASAWPDNEYTAGLPMPLAGSVFMSGEDESSAGTYTIVFENMPYDGFLAYVELIKEAGFTNDAHTEDYSQYGMEGMSYGASEASGRTVELIYSGGMAYMLITLG